jgi:predicted ATPase
LEGVAWYAELLEGAPGIKVLATSRERLNLRGERVVDLAGLPVPKDAVEDIMSFDAVRLFVERAHNVRSDFVLDEMNSQAVARICQLVEGLPLALELAAIWVRGLPLVDIVVGLEEGIELLASSSRDVPERHRSIRAVFERSWKLLSGEERTVMRKLSVFRGGFRSEAANQVAGAALGMLAGLVDKSLLRLMPSGRYDIHPLIHQYAQEQLAEDPEELVETRARHGEYHLALAKQLREKSWVRASEVQATFGEDVENIRAAWRRAVAEEQLEALELMSEPLGWWYRRVNRLLEAREDFTLAIAALNEADPRHHKALGTVHALNCAICFHLGRADEAERSARLAIKLLSPLGETQGILSGLQVLGYMALREGGFTSAQEFFGEHLSLANTLNGLDHFNALARSLFDLANVAVATGNYHEAEERYLEGLVAAREAGNSRWASDILRLLGILYLKVGRLDEAASYLDQSRALADLADSSRNISLYTDLARVALARGAFHEAWSLCQEALENVKSPGTHVAEIMLFSVMGQTAAVLGHSHEAWKYLVEGVRFGWQMGLTDALLEVLVYLSEFAADQGHTEEAFTWASVVLKHKAAPYFTKEDARRLLETLDEQLSPQERSRLLERANHIDLSLMIDKIPDVLHGTS